MDCLADSEIAATDNSKSGEEKSDNLGEASE